MNDPRLASSGAEAEGLSASFVLVHSSIIQHQNYVIIGREAAFSVGTVKQHLHVCFRYFICGCPEKKVRRIGGQQMKGGDRGNPVCRYLECTYSLAEAHRQKIFSFRNSVEENSSRLVGRSLVHLCFSCLKSISFSFSFFFLLLSWETAVKEVVEELGKRWRPVPGFSF